MRTIKQVPVSIESLIRPDGNYVIVPNEADLVIRKANADNIMAEAELNRDSGFDDVRRVAERQFTTASLMYREIERQREWLKMAREYVPKWLDASAKDRANMPYTYECHKFNVRTMSYREKEDVQDKAETLNEKTGQSETDFRLYNKLSFAVVVADENGNQLSQDQIDDLDEVEEGILWRQIDALRNPQVIDLVPFTGGVGKTSP